MMTGRHSVRSGIGFIGGAVSNGVFSSEAVGGLPLNETTIAESLNAAGYMCGAVGKWYVDTTSPSYAYLSTSCRSMHLALLDLVPRSLGHSPRASSRSSRCPTICSSRMQHMYPLYAGTLGSDQSFSQRITDSIITTGFRSVLVNCRAPSALTAHSITVFHHLLHSHQPTWSNTTDAILNCNFGCWQIWDCRHGCTRTTRSRRSKRGRCLSSIAHPQPRLLDQPCALPPTSLSSR